MMRYPYMQVDIYEEGNEYPVVTHIFNGKTKKEAYGYFMSHMSTDSFLRGAVLDQTFKGMTLRVEVSYG